MRKIIAMLMLVAALMSTVTCQAAIDYQDIPINQAFGKNGIAIGEWYDTHGNLVLTFENGYINGAQIISVGFMGDTVAFYKFRVKDGSGYKDIEISNFGSQAPEHNMLVLNDSKVLRQSQNPQYFESIGGIYLGMSKNQVMSIYGEPLSVENQSVRKTATWTYNGFEVFFNYDVVTSITIYGRGDRRFDLSGLSANSAAVDFERKYETKFSQRGNLNIGHGEVINIRDGRATLSILTPGFVF